MAHIFRNADGALRTGSLLLAVIALGSTVFGAANYYLRIKERQRLHGMLAVAKRQSAQSALHGREMKMRLSEMEKQLYRFKFEATARMEYHDISQMDLVGRFLPLDAGTIYPSPITAIFRGEFETEGRSVTVKYSDLLEVICRDVIEKYPRFPFSYYLLAQMLKRKSDPAWQAVATSGLAHLEFTTREPGRSPYHDLAKTELAEMLNPGTLKPAVAP